MSDLNPAEFYASYKQASPDGTFQAILKIAAGLAQKGYTGTIYVGCKRPSVGHPHFYDYSFYTHCPKKGHRQHASDVEQIAKEQLEPIAQMAWHVPPPRFNILPHGWNELIVRTDMLLPLAGTPENRRVIKVLIGKPSARIRKLLDFSRDLS